MEEAVTVACNFADLILIQGSRGRGSGLFSDCLRLLLRFRVLLLARGGLLGFLVSFGRGGTARLFVSLLCGLGGFLRVSLLPVPLIPRALVSFRGSLSLIKILVGRSLPIQILIFKLLLLLIPLVRTGSLFP